MLQPALRAAVLRRLGFSAPPAADGEGLTTLYAAWCARVPFDNVRKLTALHGGAAGDLPGMVAEDFFSAWVELGCGATCWPSANALCELLESVGFSCRRITGSMRDCARVNHGSVVVRLADGDWLVDSSMLTGYPVPLRRGVYLSPDPVFNHEVEAQGEEFVVWNDFQPVGAFPCRLFPATAAWAEFAQRYEGSREMSPFNSRVYARRSDAGRVSTLSGTTLYVRTAAGVSIREVAGAELPALMQEVFGHAPALLDAWQRSGAAAVNLEAPRSDAPPPPPIQGVPPSRRMQRGS
jgi:N-hydroxyarylamine O-acetyltransferase